MSISERLVDFAIGTPGQSLPESALHILRLSLLDWIAVSIAGQDEPVSGLVRELVAGEGGTPEATVVGLDRKVPARAAALCNGATAHALDYDDTHFAYLGHPSAAVMAAAFAVADKTGATGRQLLEACLIGVECACRTGVWLGRGHYDHGFHQTATSGSFGAAMAAARILKLDRERAGHALGLASTRTSGLKSQFGTMGKPYHAGMAASNGVEAALLAASGFVSRPDGLESPQGFAATHAGEMGSASEALAGLGEAYLFEAVQHKYHACCHGTHAALEAIGDARGQRDLAPEDVSAVEITVNPCYLKVCNIAEPGTALETKFSYRMTAAMALSGRDTGFLGTFSHEACSDPQLTGLRDRVSVSTDDRLSETEATVSITGRDGTAFHVRHDLATPREAAVREARVKSKAASLLGDSEAAAAWQAVSALAKDPSPFQLGSLLNRARQP